MHYYRLRESLRHFTGNVHQKVLMNIGFEPEMTRRQMSDKGFTEDEIKRYLKLKMKDFHKNKHS